MFLKLILRVLGSLHAIRLNSKNAKGEKVVMRSRLNENDPSSHKKIISGNFTSL